MTVVFTDVRLREAWSHLRSGGADALTLDVFGALLWRIVPEPAHVHVLVGERLAAAGRLPAGLTPGQFAHLRVRAEHGARERALGARGNRQVRLDEVWDALLPALPGAGPLADLIEAELATERSVCRVDLAVAELAELAATTLGLPVYLVSDTYLSGQQTRRLLARPELAGLTFAGVFTSADAGVATGDGLFGHVLAAAGAVASRVLHVGDQPAEVAPGGVRAMAAVGPGAAGPGTVGAGTVGAGTVGAGARAHGLVAVPYPRFAGDLRTTLELEGLLGEPDDDTPVDREYGDFGLTAVRARVLHRTDAVTVPAALRRFWETGATVFGPVFTGFAEWVVERTREHGAAEVFCLMPEGDFLARLLTGPGQDGGVVSHTVWASRPACALANVFDGTPLELRAFLADRETRTVGELLRGLGVDLAAVLGISALADRRVDVPGLRDATLEALCADDRIRGEIVLAAGRLRERFLRYLDARLPESGPAVLVGVGWGGEVQAQLARLLAATGRDVELVGLYLATDAGAYAHQLAGLRVEGYAVAAGQPARLASQLLRAPALVEQLCRSDVGSLTSFDAEFAPLLSLERSARTQVAQRAAAQDGVLAFQREWLRYRRSESELPSLRMDGARLAALRTLVRFVSRPTAAEAAAFGTWIQDDAGTATTIVPAGGPGSGFRPDGSAGPDGSAAPGGGAGRGGGIVAGIVAARDGGDRGTVTVPGRDGEIEPDHAPGAHRPRDPGRHPATARAPGSGPGSGPRSVAGAGPGQVRPADPAAGLLPAELIRRMPYLSPVGVASLPVREPSWPAGVAAVANRPLALVAGLAAAAGIPAEEVSAPAAAGPVEVYVDTGTDFANGPKVTAATYAGRDGLSLVRCRVDGMGARRVRIDPAGRRGLLRLDWLTLGFHLVGASAPREVTITTVDDPTVLGLVGLRILQSNLVEILDDDPQFVYNVDLSGMPELGGTYAIDVELAFGWMGIRGDPVVVPCVAPAADDIGTHLPRRAARKVMRQLGGLR